MALKKTVLTSYGFDAVNAYHRVKHVEINEKNKMSFQVESSKDGVFPYFAVKLFHADYDIEGDNPIKQAYIYLKLQPEFADAEDC